MYVLGILSSPRKDSNSSHLVREILRGAKDNGATIEFIDVNKLKIKPHPGEEVLAIKIKDDLKKVSDKIMKADYIVFGVPNYWGNMPGQLKIVMDRLSGTFLNTTGDMPKPMFKKGEKKAIIVTSSGTPGFLDPIINASKSASESVRKILSFSNITTIKHIGITGSKENNVKDNIRLVKNCYHLGKKIAR